MLPAGWIVLECRGKFRWVCSEAVLQTLHTHTQIKVRFYLWLHFQDHLENVASLDLIVLLERATFSRWFKHQRWGYFPLYTLHYLKAIKLSNKSFPIRSNRVLCCSAHSWRQAWECQHCMGQSLCCRNFAWIRTTREGSMSICILLHFT